ncbi:TPA: hypothetical protein GX533_02725 [Candidatus Dojkabacteria bacterium]|uniref:Uncharacterized protein n=1 Tax=Candidatus Dojkabacteria bacterium TaxID=2099670 RepID=A0A832QDU3_9BACT|nr:hypothetical protein [Candidatus Dojkabacteria bacterium]
MTKKKKSVKDRKIPIWIIFVILGVLGVIAVCFFFLKKEKSLVQQLRDLHIGDEYDAKPVIYLYPEEEMIVKVTVTPKANFLVTYPEYKDGWNVIAKPDGILTNIEDGREYSYLFWEAPSGRSAEYDLSTGFVVKGSDTMQFLQQQLEEMGLNEKEYNEFIVYWLPKMIGNEYNLIHFATEEEYDSRVPLEIDPQPDSVLRVFMVFKPLNQKIDIEKQTFKPFTRKGFTVIEWGGTEL